MKKLDLKKEMKAIYQPSPKAVSVVTVPAHNFLMIDGQGDPNRSPAFARAVEALYAVAYTIKFAVKKGPEAVDFGVMPLEGLWWADDMDAFKSGKRNQWKWTLMILQPDVVKAKHFKDAQAAVLEKKGIDTVKKLRFEKFNEGRAAQILHIGPYSAEGPNIEKIHDHITAQGRKLKGKHHEIYLSDMRRLPAARWKTVVRQPFG